MAMFRCGSIVCGSVFEVVVQLWFRCVLHGSDVVQLWLSIGSVVAQSCVWHNSYMVKLRFSLMWHDILWFIMIFQRLVV